MSYEKRADYSEIYMFPPSLEDWVGEKHPARFVRMFVDSLDMVKLGFGKREATEGRPNYAADMLLKLWLYGYMTKVLSSRDLERGCRDNVSLMWLSGRHEPDHNTLWRFFRDNKKALRKVLGQAVKVAAKAQLVGMVLHAVDGTKIAAASSARSGEHKKDLERALRRLDRSIDDAMRQIEAAEEKEAGEHSLPEELCDEERLRETIKAALEEMNEEGVNDYHPLEKEARMMKCGGARKQFGYNAQAVADSDSGLVLATDVVSDADDYGQLVRMVEKVEEELGQAADETVADGGYHSAEQLRRAEDRGYGVLVNLGPQSEDVATGAYHPSKFSYQPQTDECICPRGESLKFTCETVSGSSKRPVRVYHCQSFRDCPVRWQCSKAKAGRKIELSIYHDSLERQRHKQRQEEKQRALSRRAGTIEPVFGNIKQGMGFRRWTYRGSESGKTQWSLVCTAFDLRKLVKYWQTGLLASGETQSAN